MLPRSLRSGRDDRESKYRRDAGATETETKDAGLPETNARDPHKSGESPPLQGRPKIFLLVQGSDTSRDS